MSVVEGTYKQCHAVDWEQQKVPLILLSCINLVEVAIYSELDLSLSLSLPLSLSLSLSLPPSPLSLSPSPSLPLSLSQLPGWDSKQSWWEMGGATKGIWKNTLL